ncbi:hypothetical protein D1007_24187 [Hordeum vulgare]|nr:hypothetical protein D1007_24187 [Hordeum vulgare]
MEHTKHSHSGTKVAHESIGATLSTAERKRKWDTKDEHQYNIQDKRKKGITGAKATPIPRRLEALHHDIADAQEAHAKHVSEVNAKVDAWAKEIQEEADAKGVASHAIFSSLKLRARVALSSICREPPETLLTAPIASYVEISSKLMEELEVAALKVDGILEDEFSGLFFVAATHVFSYLRLHEPDFNLDEVICPIPEEYHEDLAKAVESHIEVLLGRFSAEAKTKVATTLHLEAPLCHPTIDGSCLARA